MRLITTYNYLYMNMSSVRIVMNWCPTSAHM